MQISESWLRSFVNLDQDAEALAQQLTMAGLEVESLDAVAPALEGVVVAQVLEVEKHPSADRLQVCKVDVGAATPLQIVCGASNVKPGIKVPCAQVGASLPPSAEGGKPFTIKLSQLRGIESQGMLCSAKELHLSAEGEGLLILDANARVGNSLTNELALDEKIFTIKLTPNRADCLSALGIARELAALSNQKLTLPAIHPVAVTHNEKKPVKVSAPDLCGRFVGRVLRNVNARATTPAWMVQRLERAGQRSISALVDISNYVMLELGQPTHLFDLDKLNGDLEVRWAKAGETLKLLNSTEITLDADMGVIATIDGAESLAGIMGGDRTAISLDTQNVYLEAAFWWPDAIRGKARRFNFSTDAAYRFERGVDYQSTQLALERVSALILEICGGEAGPIDDQIIHLPESKVVSMRLARAEKIIGVTLNEQQVSEIFDRLGFEYQCADQIFTVKAPSYRFDIEIEEDLIEEVARIYGFENIPANPPVAANAMLASNERQRSQHQIRHALAARDYQEVVNFSFVETEWETQIVGNIDPIKLLNPIASQLAVMRSSLLPGLLANIRYNLNHKETRVRVFEVGHVFSRVADAAHLSPPNIKQTMMVGAAAYGLALPEQWSSAARLVDYFDLKGDLAALLTAIEPERLQFIRTTHTAFHPGRSAELVLDGNVIGHIGELHPRWQQHFALAQSVVLFEVALSALCEIGLPQPKAIAKFPPVTRDLALVVERTVSAQSLLDAMQSAASQHGNLVQNITLFDMFVPKVPDDKIAANEKSLAFRITLQDAEATLSDDVVERSLSALLEAVVTRCGARLRS